MRTLLILVMALLILGCGADTGTHQIGQARITSVSPAAANRGESEIEGRIYGSNLEGMSSVDLGEGVEILDASVLSSTEIYLRFSVSPDAVPGPRTLILYAVEGTFTLDQAFTVGDNRVPKAAFTVSPQSGYRSTVFQFDASRSQDPDGVVSTYRWDFGDGKFASGKSATHKFAASGAFDVNLTVTDNRGATATTARFVEVALSRPPEAQFTVTPSSGTLGTDFHFDASSSRDSDGHITAYSWNFGDGATGAGRTASHRFSSSGIFNVSLTVTDDTRLRSTFSRTLRVDSSGGGGDDDDDDGGGTGQECRESALRQPILYGTLISADRSSQSAIVQFAPGTSCREAFVRCGDFRKSSPEKFYGIVRRVFDLGNGRFRIFVDCPPSWPDTPGESVFIIYKTCADNFCP